MQKKITRIEPHGDYSPKIFFEDGSKGELDNYSPPIPSWLKEGIILSFELRPGKFPDCPFIIPHEIVEQPVLQTTKSAPTNLKKITENKSVTLNYQQEAEELWLKKQKQIAIQSALERSTELVCAGKLEIKDLHIMAVKNFNLILQYSGIEITAKEKTKKENCLPGKVKKKKVKKGETNNAPINAPNETDLF